MQTTLGVAITTVLYCTPRREKPRYLPDRGIYITEIASEGLRPRQFYVPALLYRCILQRLCPTLKAKIGLVETSFPEAAEARVRRTVSYTTSGLCARYLTSYTTTGLCSRIVRVCGKSPVDSQKDASAPSTAAHGGCRGSTPVLVASLGRSDHNTSARIRKRQTALGRKPQNVT